MKQCSLCSRVRIDNNLWCQEPYCPAERAPIRLQTGDFVGELEIIKWVTTLPAATLYQARQSGLPVLLKLAHPGLEDKLKREAIFLQTHSHPGLPQLLSAHSDSTVVTHPYGKVTLRGQVLAYAIFASSDGRTARELLLRNAQPWHRHTGWIIAGLADTIAYLHDCGLYHLALSPEVVLVRWDSQRIPRPLLVDLGIAAVYEDIGRYWRPQLVTPSYLVPELRQKQPAGPQSDVFGLGLMLHEMLSGERNRSFASSSIVERAKMQSVTQVQEIARPDLRGLPHLATRSTHPAREYRPADVLVFANELLAYIPTVPSEKHKNRLRNHILRAVAVLALMISVVCLLAILLDIVIHRWSPM